MKELEVGWRFDPRGTCVAALDESDVCSTSEATSRPATTMGERVGSGHVAELERQYEWRSQGSSAAASLHTIWLAAWYVRSMGIPCTPASFGVEKHLETVAAQTGSGHGRHSDMPISGA